MINGMKARLFKLSDPTINKWQKEMKEGFEKTFTVVETFSKKDGPIGKLTNMLLSVPRVGLSALIPGLGSLAPLLGGVASSAMPVLTALGSMGIRFADLGKMAMAGGGLWLAFELLQEGPDKALEKIKSFVTDFWDTLKEGSPETAEWLTKTWESIKTGEIFKEIKTKFQNVNWSRLFKEAWDATSGIREFLGGIDWGGIIVSVFSYMGKAVIMAGDAIWDALFGGEETIKKGAEGPLKAGLGSAFESAIEGLKTVVKSAFEGLWNSVIEPDTVKEKFKNLAKIMGIGFGALLLLSKGFRRNMMSLFMGSGGKGGIFSGIARGLSKNKGLASACSDPCSLAGGGRGGKAGRVSKAAVGSQMFLPGFEKGGKAAAPVKKAGMFGRIAGKAGRVIGGIGGAIGLGGAAGAAKAGAGAGGAVAKGGKGVVTALKGGKTGLKGMLKMGGSLGGIFSALTLVTEGIDRIPKAFDIAGDDMISTSEKVARIGESAFLGFANVIDSAFLGIPSMLGSMLGISLDKVTGFYHELVAMTEAQMDTFGVVWNELPVIIGNVGLIAKNFIQDSFLSMINIAVKVKNHIADFMDKMMAGMFLVGRKIFYPIEYFGFKLKEWIGDFLRGVFGTEKDPTLAGIMLKKLSGDQFGDLQGFIKGLEKSNKAFLGKHKEFGDAYEAETDKRFLSMVVMNKKSEKARALANQEDDELTANAQRTLLNSTNEAMNAVGEGLGVIGDTMSGTLERARGYSDEAGDVKRAKGERERKALREKGKVERAAEKKRLEEEAKKKADEEKKKRRGKGKGAKKAPTPRERAEKAKDDKNLKVITDYLKSAIDKQVGVTEKTSVINVSLKVDGKELAKATEKVVRRRQTGTGG
jgi:hypothetical protein